MRSWPSVFRASQLQIAYRSSSEELIKVLLRGFRKVHTALKEQCWSKKEMTEKERDIIDHYTSTSFEQSKLKDDLITEMRRINDTRGIILTEPIQLYRGEKRILDDKKLRTISCDIGDCISSWSTSPEKPHTMLLGFQSTATLKRQFNNTNRITEMLSYMPTSKGTKVLLLKGLEMEVLFFQKPNYHRTMVIATT